MSNYIDIHNHCLPGLDDGARTIKESIEMLRIASEEGIKEIIVTPHYKHSRYLKSPEDVAIIKKEIEEELAKERIDITLHLGNELFYHIDIINELEQKKVNTLADSQYVLVEFYPNESLSTIKKGLYEFLTYGYYPILAHVERYEEIVEDLNEVRELLNMGAYLQINASTLVGLHGRKNKRFVKKLLKEELVQFVGTDAHSARSRAPLLSECAAYIAKKYGDWYAIELLIENPQKILLNQSI